MKEREREREREKEMDVYSEASGSQGGSGALYEQLVDLLVAGGYFRARLPGIKPFDVVLGGLVWSLTAVGGLDDDRGGGGGGGGGGGASESGGSDFFYTSSSSYSELNVGMRLKLAERLESSLFSLPAKGLGKMPTALRAHQITGLDYGSLLPAFRWLVKKVLEVRAESGDASTQLARHAFRSAYTHTRALGHEFRTFEAALASSPTGASSVAEAARKGEEGAGAAEQPTLGVVAVEKESRAAEQCERVEQALRHGTFRVKRRMRPKRRQRGADRNGDGDIDAQLERVLVEYGFVGFDDASSSSGTRGSRTSSVAGGGGGGGDGTHTGGGQAGAGRGGGGGGGGEVDGVARRATEDMESASEASLSGSAARKIVSLRRDELQEAAAKYGEDAGGSAGPSNAVANHKKQVELIQRQIDVQRQQLADVNARLSTAQAAHDDAESKRRIAEGNHDSLKQMYEKLLEAVHSAGSKEEVDELIRMGNENSTLQSKDNEKRTAYQRSLEEMQAQIASGTLRELDPEEEEEIANLDALIAGEERKREKIRAGLAKIGREVAFLRRKVEDMPTQPELLQYNRRFTELYEQVMSTLEENRRYYETYNVLVEQQKFVTKEISLQNSIKKQYQSASTTASGRAAILSSLGDIAKGVQTTVEKQNEKVERQRAVTTKLKDQLNQLNSTKRHYLSVLTMLKDEYSSAAAAAPM